MNFRKDCAMEERKVRREKYNCKTENIIRLSGFEAWAVFFFYGREFLIL